MTSRIARRSLTRTVFAALIPVALALGFAFSLNAQQTDRAKRLGARLMCVCGCNEVLTACNHVGCTTSRTMLKELDERIARGDSDDLILQSFIQEYGLTVLVDPPKHGFTGLVWFVPIIAPFVALYLVWELLRRWRHRAALAPAGGPQIPADLLDRARKEAGKDLDE